MSKKSTKDVLTSPFLITVYAIIFDDCISIF